VCRIRMIHLLRLEDFLAGSVLMGAVSVGDSRICSVWRASFVFLILGLSGKFSSFLLLFLGASRVMSWMKRKSAN